MRLLLDTNALVWMLGASRVLPPSLRKTISDPRNDVFFSAASILEIAAKRATRHRNAPPISAEQTMTLAVEAGYGHVPVTAEHAMAVETLARFHPDPFDKVLLAQAQIEDMRLVTHDENLAAYDSRTILF